MNARTGVNFHRLVKTVIQQGRRGKSKPEAYPLGYVEDFDEPRMPFGGRFHKPVVVMCACVTIPPLIQYPRISGLDFSMREMSR